MTDETREAAAAVIYAICRARGCRQFVATAKDILLKRKSATTAGLVGGNRALEFLFQADSELQAAEKSLKGARAAMEIGETTDDRGQKTEDRPPTLETGERPTSNIEHPTSNGNGKKELGEYWEGIMGKPAEDSRQKTVASEEAKKLLTTDDTDSTDGNDTDLID